MRKTTILSGFALTTAIVLSIPWAAGQTTRQSADEVLAEAARGVQARLRPRVGIYANSGDMMQEAMREMSVRLAPYQDILKEEGTRRVRALPKLEMNPDDWEAIGPAVEGLLAGADTKLAGQGSVFIAYLWNPIAAANTARQTCRAIRSSTEEMGPLAVLDSIAAPAWYCVDDSADAPVLAAMGGLELYVIRLKRAQGGYFVDVDTRVFWNRKVARPATRGSVPTVQPAKPEARPEPHPKTSVWPRPYSAEAASGAERKDPSKLRLRDELRGSRSGLRLGEGPDQGTAQPPVD